MNRDEKAREELHKKKHQESLEQMKNVKCAWPECKKKQFMQMSLPVMLQTSQGLKPVGLDGKEGKPGEETSMSIPVPICDYHMAILASGLCAVVKQEGKEGFNLFAPVDMVRVAEAVIQGLIMTGKLKKLMNLKEENEQKAKGMQQNEQAKKNEQERNKSTDTPSDK